MKHVIAIGESGYIDAADHRKALEGLGDVPVDSVVRFYFGRCTWIDIKFDRDGLQVRAMSHTIPSLAVQPESGNTITIVPGR